MQRVRTAVQVVLLSFSTVASRTTSSTVHAASLVRLARVTSTRPATRQPEDGSSAFDKLPPVSITNINSREVVSTKLYTTSGQLDERAAQRLDSLLCDARDPNDVQTHTMDRRLLQLIFRTAYHFGTNHVEVVSAYRKAVHKHAGVHAQGRAIDFRLSNVTAPILAAYLRTLPRVGVGIYTHPKTQFVHLDVREHSFHWLDASPPRRHWREKNIGSKALTALDATYKRANDWPEGLPPPVPFRDR